MNIRSCHSRTDGNVLLVAILMVAVIAAILGAGSLLNSTLMKNADRSQHHLEANALADGALDALFAQWRRVAVDNPLNSGTPPRINDEDGNAIAPPNIAGVTDGMVQLVKPTMAVSNGKLEYVPMDPGTAPDMAVYAGGGNTPVYLASASIQLPSPQGTVDMEVRQLFRYAGRSPTDWAIIELVPERTVDWNNEDGTPVTLGGSLEIHPGATMKLDNVHTNGTLYIASNKLELEGRTTYGEEMVEDHDPDENRDGGGNPSWNNDLPPTKDDRVDFFNIQPGDLELGVNPEDRDSNPNNDSYREMLDAPVNGFDDPLDKAGEQSQRPYDQAAIKIEIDDIGGSEKLVVRKRDGTEVLFGDDLYNTVLKAINPTRDLAATTADADGRVILDPAADFQTIRDNRAQNDVRLTSLDIETIRLAFEGGNNTYGIPNISDYDFGFPSGVLPEKDDTRAIIDPGTSTLPNGWNGAIHFEDKTANPVTIDVPQAQKATHPDVQRALRLRRAGSIPKLKRIGTDGDGTLVGLTVVTPNPAYVHGDFNTGSSYADYNSTLDSQGLPVADPVVKPDSSTDTSNNLSNFDGENHVVSGYEDDAAVAKDADGNDMPVIPPAALIADAVNILSNNWNDSLSNNSLGDRDATGTTVNSAIISGVVPSGAKDARGNFANNKYSGGAENYPRFLENWSGTVFCYHGSMIMAFESEQAYFGWKGTGNGPNVYNAPKRYWFHEDGFKTIYINDIPTSNAPPLLPNRIYSYPRSPKIVESFSITQN